MLTKIKSFLVPNRYFSTLPDGKRVFRPGIPWTKSYIINDVSTEQRLYKKTLWLNLFSNFFIVVIIIGLPTLITYNKQFWDTYNEIILLTIIIFTLGLVWLVYNNDLMKLQKINASKFTQEFIINLQNGLRNKTRNAFPDYNINKYFDIPNHTDKIVILRHSKQFPNIVRCSSDGNIVWQSELPSENDVYTNLEWKNQNLFAFSQSCKTVILDLVTGKIIQRNQT